MSARPRLVLISGSPGSGKTTLATALAAHLRVLHISKDRLTSGLTITNPMLSADDANVAGWAQFWPLLDSLLRSGVSLVAEQTLWRGWSEEPARALRAVADVLNIHTRCPHALDRWEVRMRADGMRLPVPLDEFARRVRGRADEFTDPLDLGCPVLEVDTTDGYDPTFGALLGAIVQR